MLLKVQFELFKTGLKLFDPITFWPFAWRIGLVMSHDSGKYEPTHNHL